MLATNYFFRDSVFNDLFSISRDLNRFFEDDSGSFSGAAYPLSNIYEDEDNFYIVSEIPGVNKEDIKINVTAHSLTIEGKRENELKDDSKISCHRSERSFGSFSRTYSLNGRFDTEKVGAEYKNGILKITLPKSEEKKPKAISIKAE